MKKVTFHTMVMMSDALMEVYRHSYTGMCRRLQPRKSSLALKSVIVRLAKYPARHQKK